MIDDLGRIRAVVDNIDLHFYVLLVHSNFARVIKSVLHRHSWDLLKPRKDFLAIRNQLSN